MTALTFRGFRAVVPRTSERLQPGNFAHKARNIKISNGNIVPMKGMLLSSTTLTEAIRSMWRYRRVANGQASENWLTFENDTDVCRSPLASDPDGRVYWTSEAHEPRMSTFEDAIDGAGPYPDAWFMLGVPSPTVKPAVSVSGGSGTNVTRSYVYTFVTALGEESGPSPPSDLDTGFPDGTWAITGMQTAPANSGTASAWTDLPNGNVEATLNSTFGMQVGTTLVMIYDTAELADPIVETVRLLAVNHTTGDVEFLRDPYPAGTTPTLTWQRAAHINTTGMVKRIYRTQGTAASFLYVAEVPAATTTYDDSTVILTGEVIQTTRTQPAPATLQGLTSLPNGCFVGFTENEVCLSDPYLPYSWPIQNRYQFASRCIALGQVGNSVVLLTDSYPIMLTGSDPEAMSPAAMETYAPCLGKRGAVNVGGGMMYQSNDGIWLASIGAIRLMTSSIYRIDEWTPMNPSSFDAAFHDGKYIAVHEPIGGDGKQIMVIDITEMDSVVTVDDYADALYRNDYDGQLYTAKGARILRWDADDLRRYISEWTSVEIQLSQPTNFSVAQVHANFSEVVPPDESVLEANQALIAEGPDAVGGFLLSGNFLDFEFNGSNLVPYNPPTPRTVQLVIYEGEEPKFAKQVQSARPFRLPSGFKSEKVRVGINASVQCYSASLAESTEELKDASK